MSGWLTASGFDPDRLAFAFRTAVAACIAFVLAWAIGLEHPQWSAMTVWAASQPTRGQLWEKALFRFLGSVSGSVVGVLLVLAMQIDPALLVVGLALWVAACTYIGNLQRGFVAYGTVLAGYTAAMVALLDTGGPDHVLALGADRLATVLTGVVVATLIGSLFAPALTADGLRGRVRTLLAEMLAQAARPDPGPDLRQRLLGDLTAIEDSLDPHGAGSRRGRAAIRSTRALLIAAMPLLLWRHGAGQPEALRAGLEDAAAALNAGQIPAARRALERAAGQSGLSPRIGDTLTDIAEALEGWDPRPGVAHPVPRTILHRDWIGAREAGLRALGALLLFGVIWQVTGWSVGPFLLLGLSIMISLFSTFENPVQMMRYVFTGQAMGVAGALVLRWLVWPLAQNEWQMILLTLPLILIGPLFVGHRRTMAVSFDYNMVLMLMSQPHWPLTGSFAVSLEIGLAVIAAPLAGMASYLLVYPPNLRRRIDTLMRTMLNDLRDMAADPHALDQRQVWRARLYHRMLRLQRLSERTARARGEAREMALVLLNLEHVAMLCHRIEADQARSLSERRSAGVILARLARTAAAPRPLRDALVNHARRHPGAGSPLFRDAAEGVDALVPLLGRLAVGARAGQRWPRFPGAPSRHPRRI